MDKVIGLVTPLPIPEIPSAASLIRSEQARPDGESSVERAKFKKAATEFESFFIFYMMKTMRQAVPKSDLLDSRHSDTFLSLLDQEVAGQAAKRGGFGLAKVLENQYFPTIHARPSSSGEDRPIEGLEKEGL
jgi:Rod binding domain-containing protein